MSIESFLEDRWTSLPRQDWIAIKDHRLEFRKTFGTDRVGKLVGTSFYVTLTQLAEVTKALIRHLGREPVAIKSTNGARDVKYWGFDASGLSEENLSNFVKRLAAAIDDLL